MLSIWSKIKSSTFNTIQKFGLKRCQDETDYYKTHTIKHFTSTNKNSDAEHWKLLVLSLNVYYAIIQARNASVEKVL